MRTNRQHKRPFWLQFAAFMAEGDDGADKGGGAGGSGAGAGDDAKKADAGKGDDGGKADDSDDVAALKKQLEDAQKRAADFEKADKERKEKERTDKLSAEQKAAELEQKLKAAERSALVERVRRANGFGDAVYDVVTPEGDDEAAIKGSYEAYKKTLDEYLKANGAKEAPGKGTDGGKPPAGKDVEADKRPRLVRLGLVSPKEAV